MTTGTELATVPQAELLADWTPESLKLAMQNEKQLRSVVIDYCKDAMQQGHHFYKLEDRPEAKPALSKEGALNLCSLFKVTPSPDTPAETFHEDGHYTVRSRCHILNRNGQIVASGDGICSTRESKYAYRWMFGNEIPAEIDKEQLKKREGTSRKTGRPYVQYQVPNQDLPDVYNTVLKMSSKRAMVDAVLKLPLVSELFTQDLEEQITEVAQQKKETKQTRRQEPPAAKMPPKPLPDDPNAGIKGEIFTLCSDLNQAEDSIKWSAGKLNEYSVERFEKRVDELTPEILMQLRDDLQDRLDNLR